MLILTGFIRQIYQDPVGLTISEIFINYMSVFSHHEPCTQICARFCTRMINEGQGEDVFKCSQIRHVLSVLCRSGLRSLLHPSHRHGWLLFPHAYSVGVRHRPVWEWDWHLCVGASGAVAHRSLLLEGGAAGPQCFCCKPVCVWCSAPANHTPEF